MNRAMVSDFAAAICENRQPRVTGIAALAAMNRIAQERPSK